MNSAQTDCWSHQVKWVFLILPEVLKRLEVKKKNNDVQLCWLLWNSTKTIFFTLPTWDLELRCLMNWKDFKCSRIIKSSERWRAERSGRCARPADQEDLKCYQWKKRKTSQNRPQRYELRICSHTFHSSPSTVLRKSVQHKHELHIHFFAEWFMHERQGQTLQLCGLPQWECVLMAGG